MELEYQQNYLAEGQSPNHPLSSLVQTEPLPQPLMLGLRQPSLFNTLDFFLLCGAISFSTRVMPRTMSFVRKNEFLVDCDHSIWSNDSPFNSETGQVKAFLRMVPRRFSDRLRNVSYSVQKTSLKGRRERTRKTQLMGLLESS